MKKRLLSLLLAMAMLSALAVPAFAQESLEILAPAQWELQVGDSRTLDYGFADTESRMLLWTTSDETVASVDMWGRVTGVAPGEATVTATQLDGSLTDSVTVKVVAKSERTLDAWGRVDYAGTAIDEVENLQKIVTRYEKTDETLPEALRDAIAASDRSAWQSCTTADGAKWEIKPYGVLRTDENALTQRDREMRFMGDRYLNYSHQTVSSDSLGDVLAILADGKNGIWTLTEDGVTHIEMVEMSAAEKASQMSNTTQQYVARRGMVSQAYWNGTKWVPQETDNDGLWTAMYGAGELMRYAVLREQLEKNPHNPDLQRMTEEARKSATSATEAVLLLANIPMRTGTVETYVRYIADGGYTLYNGFPIYDNSGKDLSGLALVKGGDYSLTTPNTSPAYNTAMNAIRPVSPDAWLDPFTAPEGTEFATQTRLLAGFIARTYSLHGEEGGNADRYDGEIYYDFADFSPEDPTAEGKSAHDGTVNGDLLKGIRVDASGQIPERLWNDLLGGEIAIQDIVYKGDTSTDELIGHLFIYKIAYDVFRDSDPELASIISTTVNGIAQHLSDNEYMLVDAAGQPTTWGKLNRDYFYTYRWGAPSSPLTSAVLLTAFKVAAHVTGYEKWENEYRFLLENGSHLYGEIMATHSMRDEEFLNKYAAPMLADVIGDNDLSDVLRMGGLPTLLGIPDAPALEKELSFLLRSFAQYSDEEMAMLAFYTLFQLEKDPITLAVYRKALDQWWDESISYSENPLWYYIYQLSRPSETVTDAYGNNILETAAWSLSRHPIDTRLWLASNDKRDDIRNINLENYSSALDTRGGLSIRYTDKLPDTAIGEAIIPILLTGGITNGGYDLSALGYPLSGEMEIEYAVAAPDERALHKFNGSTYVLGTYSNDYNPGHMEGSTTYTLPYWMGVYHGMLKLSAFEQTEAPKPEGTVRVYAKVPESWEAPHIWAWDGGDNAFPAWPGAAMTQAENGWWAYDIPEWCTGVIINANGGKVQTQDLLPNPNEDVIYIEVSEADGKISATVTYRIPATGDGLLTALTAVLLLAATAGAAVILGKKKTV